MDFKIEPGLIYIMIPGQVRSWDYPDEIDGYAVNFSEIHFSESANAWRKLEEFPFFSWNCEKQVMQLQGESQEQIIELFEKIFGESKNLKDHAIDMIRALLFQLFISVGRIAPSAHQNPPNKSGYLVLPNFQKLLIENFAEKKLPSEYASLL